MIRDLTIEYDKNNFDFVKYVSKALNVRDLEKIHTMYEGVDITRANDQDTHFHKMFYKAFDGDDGALIMKYHSFARYLGSTLFNEPFIYQKVPTFRIQRPNSKAVGEWHSDVDYGHAEGEINFWVPLTRAYNTAAVKIGPVKTCAQNYKDNMYLGCKFGEVLIFDGSYNHGNDSNEEEYSRVSFDFRIIPKSQYVENAKASINSGKKLVAGDYFTDWNKA